MHATYRVTTFLAASVILVGVAAALGGSGGAAAAPVASRAGSPAVASAAGAPAGASPAAPHAGASPAAPVAAERMPARSGAVRLTEVAPARASGRSEGFFELMNPGEHPVELSGYAVYRCDDEGLRARPTDPEADLRGVALAPGERRAFATARLSERGYGLVVVDPEGSVVDAVAVFPDDPAPMMSECGGRAELPVTTAAALDESWQRLELGSGADDRWLRATATPGASNGLPRPATSGVRIDEIAAAGPGGHGDDFVELRNTATTAVALTGWRLYRCTASGAAPTEALQHVFGAGAALAPGERLVIGGPDFEGAASVRTATSLADSVSGALLVTSDGRRVDGVGVSSHEDTACQTGRDKLPSALDYRTGESWQRQPDGGFSIATRTPGDENAAPAAGAASVSAFSYRDGPGVVVSELANDPVIEGMPRRNFVELANVGDVEVDLSGWTLVACGVDGFRRVEDLAVIAPRTVLAPDETWTAALAGTPLAGAADARFEVALALEGAGVWLEDAEGRRVDSVGVYHRNEMDASIDRDSPCTKGMPLSTFAVDRLRGETLQRTGFTGDDATDFVPAAATPGVRAWPRSPSTDDLVTRALDLARASAADDAVGTPAASGVQTAPVKQGTPVEVVEAFAGSSPAPLEALDAPEERAVSTAEPAARDDAYGLPYVRLRVAVPPDGSALTWQGRTVGRALLRLSVWTPSSVAAAGAWRTLDEAAGGATAADAAADARVTLEGSVRPVEVVSGVAELLVQVVPGDTAVSEPDGIADAADYDLAIGHVTDTQYYSEAYPEVYAAQVAWLAENADARKLAFVTHTGDLIQNWVDPAQPEDRARREYALASRMQAVLDAKGIANSVLPGNHDNKRGVSNALFNDYFGPARYRDQPWYGGSLTPDDNSANWSAFEAGGARFVMISLPYAYGEREISWAEAVVAAHPRANIAISTHEHLTPATGGVGAERSTTSRWVSHGDLLWERVVAPNRNVVLVLSGHFHGVGAIVTENAGGIPGHTVVEALGDYQEFRTPTGERATGFQRLLQIDLAAGVLAVDTFSVPLSATASHPYDYVQFLPDDGNAATPSNERPWRILAQGLQGRYTAGDDAFSVPLSLQHAKAVETDAVTSAP
ncbi:lamin tail domain-containing protein [Microbacterium hibisci]|uniref:lamin tail domain-containing protein n=1 Tax=Microbacterium hibisci TaxID=2036000 RepID=UPI00194123D8|nr:lamin tail domain-containing protein [Microbacterium hibisci]